MKGKLRGGPYRPRECYADLKIACFRGELRVGGAFVLASWTRKDKNSMWVIIRFIVHSPQIW